MQDKAHASASDGLIADIDDALARATGERAHHYLLSILSRCRGALVASKATEARLKALEAEQRALNGATIPVEGR